MIMKKLLALILALMMTVCLFAACGEKEEAKVDETATVRPLAEEALALVVARDAEALLPKLTDEDPAVDPGKSLVAKCNSYAAVITKFEAQVDTWEISDELKAEVKAYAATKADEVLASFKAEGVKDVTDMSGVITASAKAQLLNVTGDAYKAIYTAPGNYAKFAGVECPEIKEVMTEEETAAVAKADEDAKAAIKVMTIDELKVVTDNVFAAIQDCVVDTDVAFQYKKVNNEWKINYVGISAVE